MQTLTEENIFRLVSELEYAKRNIISVDEWPELIGKSERKKKTKAVAIKREKELIKAINGLITLAIRMRNVSSKKLISYRKDIEVSLVTDGPECINEELITQVAQTAAALQTK